MHLFFGAYAVARPYVEARKIKLLAVSNSSRPLILNDLPTAREAGYPELELDGLVGLFGSPTMSSAARERIAADVIAATVDQEVSRKLIATGQMVVPGGPTEFAASINKQRGAAERAAKILGLNHTN